MARPVTGGDDIPRVGFGLRFVPAKQEGIFCYQVPRGRSRTKERDPLVMVRHVCGGKDGAGFVVVDGAISVPHLSNGPETRRATWRSEVFNCFDDDDDNSRTTIH